MMTRTLPGTQHHSVHHATAANLSCYQRRTQRNDPRRYIIRDVELLNPPTNYHAHNEHTTRNALSPVHTSNTLNNVAATGNNVEATFDFVEATFYFVERIVRLVAFNNVASTLLQVLTGL